MNKQSGEGAESGEGLREQVGGEYVVYRTGYPQEPKPVEYIEARRWDIYTRENPDTKCVFISRGHTRVEARILTKLANEGVEE